jgi:hypothetical protein
MPAQETKHQSRHATLFPYVVSAEMLLSNRTRSVLKAGTVV